MSSSDDDRKKSLEVLKSLDEAIEQGLWEKSLFLRGISKKLRDARDRFAKDLRLNTIVEDITDSAEVAAAIAGDDVMEVYISLYQAEGSNFQRWATVLASLPKMSISRPAYKGEEHIKSILRSKDFKDNDAYVVVKIRKTDVVPPVPGEKIPLDRYGHELLILKERAIRLEHIIRFIHVSGFYTFDNGHLVKQASPTQPFV